MQHDTRILEIACLRITKIATGLNSPFGSEQQGWWWDHKKEITSTCWSNMIKLNTRFRGAGSKHTITCCHPSSHGCWSSKAFPVLVTAMAEAFLIVSRTACGGRAAPGTFPRLYSFCFLIRGHSFCNHSRLLLATLIYSLKAKSVNVVEILLNLEQIEDY